MGRGTSLRLVEGAFHKRFARRRAPSVSRWRVCHLPVPGRNVSRATARLLRRRLRGGALAFGEAPGFLFGGEPGGIDLRLRL